MVYVFVLNCGGMKKLLLLIVLSFVFITLTATISEARTSSVRGSFRRNGSYVVPHYRTSPNRTKLDNWSSKGNYNPYTGKKGYTDPFRFKYRK